MNERQLYAVIFGVYACVHVRAYTHTHERSLSLYLSLGCIIGIVYFS